MASASAVADPVLKWFAASSIAQKKHPQGEWTVLAGIVLRVSRASLGDEYRVLATGTGTKCLGRRDLDANGYVVNDSHAEIIARRAFLRYLYTEVLQWLHCGRVHTDSIFQVDTDSNKLILKPDHELHLFVNEAPCGDAAIYPLRNDIVDAFVDQRLHAGQPRSDLRLTGAKLRQSKRPRVDGEDAVDDETVDQPADKRYEQMIGIARTKSGRSDLPVDKQTLSMSCSDKIAKWTVVGVQGRLLSQWFAPLVLASVVVGKDPSSHSTAAQQRAVERALRDRLYPAVAKHAVDVYVLAQVVFNRQREPTKIPSPVSLNWTRHEGHWATDTNVKASAFCAPTDTEEVLMGATGYKQGAMKASKMTDTVKRKLGSRLSKWSLFNAYTTLRRLMDSESTVTTYSEAKAVLSDASDLVQQAKDQLARWVGVPSSYKGFTLPQ